MKIRLHIVLILSIVYISACSANRSENLPCSSLVNERLQIAINNSLVITAPNNINTFKYVDPISFNVDNKSDSVIEIAPDKNLKIYLWNKNKWQAVINQVEYLSEIDRIRPKSNTNPGGTIYPAVLDVPNNLEVARICIVLDGVENPDLSPSKVVSYVEVTLYP